LLLGVSATASAPNAASRRPKHSRDQPIQSGKVSIAVDEKAQAFAIVLARPLAIPRLPPRLVSGQACELSNQSTQFMLEAKKLLACSAPPARNRFNLFRQRLKALIRSLMHAAGLLGTGLTGVRAAPEPRPDSL
jgi:hypothetical protein